jgi:metal-sulfur cluster biosynthetic enzyme
MPVPNVPRSSRTESIDEKLALVQQACQAQRWDLVESLADSIKDSVQYERQMAAGGDPVKPGADDFIRVGQLPQAWAAWARGWQYCKIVRLFETVGMARQREPLELLVAFHGNQVTDPPREIRVARVDRATAALEEIPSQILQDGWRGEQRVCRLAFLADVEPHRDATYLIFYGNPLAELPRYITDLEVRGEQWKLDIENEYFVARLSQQMGQLERITSKREHGLELYAGGKGHGEPPTIDWAHDYVEQGGYQKLRIKDWDQCRNFEVIRGPVCTRVRRWGFPRSPIHPAISPARMHVDVAYSFWAGMPTFFKESTMEALVSFGIEAMRDDEWVFSGYSFTQSLWIDASGKVHEGAVPAEHQQNLWGVGFANETSRDAFVALWLEHTVTGRDSIQHGGVPTLHYQGHGQLWSRYPADRTTLAAGTRFQQRNAYLLMPWTSGGAEAVERERHRWTNPLAVSEDMFVPPDNATKVGQLARSGETPDTAGPKHEMWKMLRDVRDDQLYDVDANIVDLGYVYDLRYRAGVAHVIVTMPHRGRPVHDFLVTQGGGRVEEGIQERLMRVPGVRSVAVSVAWNPPWSLARVSKAGRRVLGL